MTPALMATQTGNTYMTAPIQDYASANEIVGALRRRFPSAEVLMVATMPEIAIFAQDAQERVNRTQAAVSDLQKVKEGLV